VAGAAIELSQAVFGDLRGRRVLLLGAGKMTQAALGLLKNSGVERISVVNRTLQRATELAARCGGEAVAFDQLDRTLGEVDLLIASTGAPHYVVTRERLEQVMKGRRGRPLLLVDIAVPRDIEPSCADLDNVYLYNIDDLQDVVVENLSRRNQEMEKVLTIVRKECVEFLRDLDARKSTGAIQIMRGGFEKIRDAELEKFLGKHSPNEEEAARLRLFSQQLLNKLLHQPTQRLRELGGGGIEPEQLAQTLHLLGLSPEPQTEPSDFEP
jgi:glutamyl-tRNA reductase